MKYSAIFGYYGGKSKIAQHYPSPWFDTIIEPFAGSAAYAARYYWKNVIICDKDPQTAAIWDVLLDRRAMSVVMNALPDKIKKGQHIHQIVPRNSHPGIIGLARTGIQVGSSSQVCWRVTERGARDWRYVKNRLRIMIPLIQHWQFIHGDYKDLDNEHGTWFIDPPYNNDAGRAYATNAIDYSHLGKWCQSRKGQVIVCENVGAKWLPFRELDTGRSGAHADYQPAKEAIWTNEFNVEHAPLDTQSGHSL